MSNSNIQIPNFLDMQIVDKDGFLTPTWRQLLMQLFNELQSNLSPEGYKLPQQDATNVSKLNNSGSLGAILYNTDTNKAMINENGSFKTIQTY